jgi:hypothetical protein
VSGVQPVSHANRHIQQRFEFHGPARDCVFECLALQIFHSNEAPAVMLANFVDCADVRMVQRGGGSRLAAEASKGSRVFNTMNRRAVAALANRKLMVRYSYSL